MKFLKILFLGILLTAAMSAYTQVLTGVVTDPNGNGLEYATISLLNASDSSLIDGSISDLDGKFEIKPKPGTYRIQIAFLSYGDYFSDILELKKGSKIDLKKIALQPAQNVLGEVNIRAERSETIMKLDKRVFNVGKDLVSRSGSVLDVLDNVPSVAVNAEGGVTLRGNENVRILINGKPSGLTGVSTADALKTIPSGSIERVEVITNPSAKYEAEGTGGIINIILKKSIKEGLNGIVNANVGSPESYGIGLNLNYRKGKINWFTDFGANKTRRFGQGFENNTFKDPSADIVYSNQKNHRQIDGTGVVGRAGLDYYMTEKDIFTVYGLYRYSEDINDALIQYDDFTKNRDPLAHIDRHEDEFEYETIKEFTARYDHLWKGQKHKITSDFQYSNNTEDEGSDFDIREYAPIDQLNRNYEQRTRNIEIEEKILGKVDYLNEIGTNSYEAGVQLSLRNISTEYNVEEKLENSWKTIGEYQDDVKYDEDIYAAYVTYGREFNERLSSKVGLRAEYSNIKTLLKKNNIENPRDYLNFFPTAHVSYKLDQKNSVQASYSRRISRPGFWFIIPYLTYNNERSVFRGNPNINPEYSDNYELGYLRQIEKGSLLFSIYYKNEQDVISIISTQTGELSFVRQPENIGSRDNLGLEFNFSKQLTKTLRFNGEANLFYYDYKGSLNGENFSQTDMTTTGRGSLILRLKNGFSTQLNCMYRGGTKTPQGKRKSVTHLNFAASKDITKQLSITLSVKDVFNSRKRRYLYDTATFLSDGEQQWRGRSALLELSYRINRSKNERNRRKSLRTDD